MPRSCMSPVACRDRFAGLRQIARVSVSTAGAEADNASSSPSISGNGRYVVFQSAATNLVTGDSDSVLDVFLRDRDTDADGILDEPGAVATTPISVGDGGAIERRELRGFDHAGTDGSWCCVQGDEPLAGERQQHPPGLSPRSHHRRDRAGQARRGQDQPATACRSARPSAPTATTSCSSPARRTSWQRRPRRPSTSGTSRRTS